MLFPRQPTPDLDLPLAGGGRFNLALETAERGTVICFYRGLHCPICANYLKELDKLTPEFEKRGYSTIAVSSDNEERATAMAEKVGAASLRFAYALPLGEARAWGLYISTGRGKTSIGIDEPPLFSEPGVFIVNADRTLYSAQVQTMPFVRPHFRELLSTLDFVIEKNYPARGEYTGPV